MSISIQHQEANKLVSSKHNGTVTPPTKVAPASSHREKLLTRLSVFVLANESVDNLRHNTSLASALDRYPERVDNALEFFQQALSTWKNKPGIGLFIHAVKTGQKPSLTKPGCGAQEWADQATKRQLMEYSHSHDGDIMVHFVGGVSKLLPSARRSVVG